MLSEQSLDTLLDRIADTLDELVPYDALQIYEADNDAQRADPRARAHRVGERDHADAPRLRAGDHGLGGRSSASRCSPTRLISTPASPSSPARRPSPRRSITIPLIARGSLKGALNIYRLGETASFAEDEFELAKWFGDAAALALDNAQVRARLEHQAQTDSLTGLYNHRDFHERLRAELMRASRARDSVALLMFDIDEFKRVNDICGHGVGDQILVALAELTCSLVRTSDVVCRIGGEEFAVIMPSCDAGDALGLARRLIERLEARPVDAAGEITISVGIAHGPANAGNPRELVDCAESAMMAAKARGKNRIVVYSGRRRRAAACTTPGRDVRSIAHLKMLQSVAGAAQPAEQRERDRRGDRQRAARPHRLPQLPRLSRGGRRGRPDRDQGRRRHGGAGRCRRLRIKLGTGVTGHVAATGPVGARSRTRSTRVRDPDPRHGDGRRVGDRRAAPLRQSNVTGVVFLSKLGVGQFDESDLRLLEVLAGYAAVVARERPALREPAPGGRPREGLARLRGRHLRRELAGADRRRDREGDREARSTARSRRSGSRTSRSVTSAVLPVRVAGDTSLEGAMCDTASLVLRPRRSSRCRPQPRLVAAERVGGALPADPSWQISARWLWRRFPPGTAFAAGWPWAAGVRRARAHRRAPAPARGARRTARRWRFEKARLARYREQSLHVADALLEFARALARAERATTSRSGSYAWRRRCSTRRRCRSGCSRSRGGACARWPSGTNDDEHRALLLAARFPAEVAQPFSERPEPFVLEPEEYTEIPGATELGRGGDFAVAPFALDDGRMGFLVAGARRRRDVRRAAAEDARRVGRPGQARACPAPLAKQRHDVRGRTGRGSGAGPRPARGRRGA